MSPSTSLPILVKKKSCPPYLLWRSKGRAQNAAMWLVNYLLGTNFDGEQILCDTCNLCAPIRLISRDSNAFLWVHIGEIFPELVRLSPKGNLVERWVLDSKKDDESSIYESGIILPIPSTAGHGNMKEDILHGESKLLPVAFCTYSPTELHCVFEIKIDVFDMVTKRWASILYIFVTQAFSIF